MKKNIVILLFYLLLNSCHFNEQSKIEIVNNLPHSNKYIYENKRDTIINYDIQGISSEGTQAKVSYIGGKIRKSVVNIYGETGQANIVYIFLNNRINVTEKKYAYKAVLADVHSSKDIILEKEISYVLDFNGKPIGKGDADRIDIFSEFKKTVPFELK